MHLLGKIDGLEPGGEGPHQITRQCRRTVPDARGELGARLLVAFAAADGGHPVELHQLEQLLSALLAQYLADKRAQRVDVVAQGRMLRGKLDVAAIHDKRPAFYPIGRGSPCQQDGFGALELLRLAVDHDDVAVAQYGLSGGLTAEDALTPDAGEGNLDSTAVDIAQGAAHRPRPWRDHH